MIYNDLKGKTAIVTGAGKKTGIGYAIAEKLASSRLQHHYCRSGEAARAGRIPEVRDG